MSKYIELFVTESRDHLAAMEQAVLSLEQDPHARAPLDALFRAVHTLKGMSGAMGYDPITVLSHALESRLDRARSGDDPLSGEDIDTLLAATDTLEQAVTGVTRGETGALDTRGLLARLGHARAARDATTARATAEGSGPHLLVTLEPGTPLPGARAQLVVARLARLGSVRRVHPPLSALDGQLEPASFSVWIDTAADASTIEREARSAGFVGGATWVSAARVDAAASTARDGDQAWGGGDLTAPLQKYVRIESRRLDLLMNLVGELVTLRGRMHSVVAGFDDPQLREVVAHAGRLVGELQDGVIGARMVPVWQVFDRFPRVVREAARAAGKEALLQLEGREIELDRALLEQVADPLVHLLRNAVDHGIEPPDRRREAGKRVEGLITLTARRERNAVVIIVRDDGAGVNRERVLTKAQSLGWVGSDTDTLTDAEVLRFISRAGFSTAAQVTQVSGRGVGIDAVMAKVRGLGGSVEFSSRPGEGTAFELRLPVTLAIIPAIVARVGDESYALPLTHITETLQPSAGVTCRVRGRPVFVLRNQVLPLYRLREVVGLGGRDPDGTQVVIVEASDRKAALVVDRLEGQDDIVVKTFDAVRGMIPGIAGATVLPDGRTAMIMDAGGIL